MSLAEVAAAAARDAGVLPKGHFPAGDGALNTSIHMASPLLG